MIADRALQALTVNALEPEWEARFESRSYGFRPGRGCQDAMQAIFVTARGATCKRQWVLDADLAAAFDQIDHSRLLDQLGTFPARGMISAWLTAGVMDHGQIGFQRAGHPASSAPEATVDGSQQLHQRASTQRDVGPRQLVQEGGTGGDLRTQPGKVHCIAK